MHGVIHYTRIYIVYVCERERENEGERDMNGKAIMPINKSDLIIGYIFNEIIVTDLKIV